MISFYLSTCTTVELQPSLKNSSCYFGEPQECCTCPHVQKKVHSCPCILISLIRQVTLTFTWSPLHENAASWALANPCLWLLILSPQVPELLCGLQLSGVCVCMLWRMKV